MNYLIKYGLVTDDLINICKSYDLSIINSIIYKKKNVIKILDYLKENNFINIKDLIINRLDIFLVDYNQFKLTFEKYNSNNLIKYLNQDFSIFDILE